MKLRLQALTRIRYEELRQARSELTARKIEPNDFIFAMLET